MSKVVNTITGLPSPLLASLESGPFKQTESYLSVLKEPGASPPGPGLSYSYQILFVCREKATTDW